MSGKSNQRGKVPHVEPPVKREKALSVGEQLMSSVSRAGEIVRTNSEKAREFMSKLKTKAPLHPPFASITTSVSALLHRAASHLTASSSAGLAGPAASQGRGGAGSATASRPLLFASISLAGEKGGAELTHEMEKKVMKLMEELTPEERTQLLDLVEYRVAQDTPFDVKWAKRFTEPNGDHPFKDCKTWAEFYEAREKMEERIRRGSGQRTFAGDKDAYWVRQDPRYALPGATEVELPQDLETELELLMVGAGTVDGPVHPWLASLYPRLKAPHVEVGIYARPKEMQDIFKSKYGITSKRAKVSPGPELPQELLNAAPAVELTLCASAVRDLSLAELKEKIEPLMKEALKKDGATKADMRAADAFLAQFDPNLVTAQWLDKRGTIAKGTKLFISTSPEGNVVTEVMSQGRLVDKGMTSFGEFPSKKVARAVFGVILGEQSLSEQCKQSALSGVLTITNSGLGKDARKAAARKAVEESIPAIEDTASQMLERRRQEELDAQEGKEGGKKSKASLGKGGKGAKAKGSAEAPSDASKEGRRVVKTAA